MNVRVPDNEKTANALLLKGEHAIFPNLPVPRVYEIFDHAVVDIDDLLDLIYAHGVPTKDLQDEFGNIDETDINGTMMAKLLFEEWKEEVGDESIGTRFGLVSLWSDGFQRAWVKRKNNNVWIMTMTLQNKEKNSTSQFHTYCIALGKGSLDHVPVVDHVMEQFQRARGVKLRYCGRTGTFVNTAVGVNTYAADRIERCAVLRTLFLGDYGLRSHFASALDANALPMCVDCFSSVIASLQRDIHPVFGDDSCQRCCRWDYLSQGPASTTNPLPKHYPATASPDSPEPPSNRTVAERYLLAKRQTFPWLIQGLEYAFHNLTVQQRRLRWSQKNAFDFLRSMAINKALQKKVWNSAVVWLNHPGTLLQYIPPLWLSGFSMERFLNSPMHLLFEGIVLSVMDLIETFTKKVGSNKEFNTLSNEFLSEIGEKFRLDWCKMRLFPHTEWQAEDFLGLSRILPCLYELFLLNKTIPEEHRNAAHSIHQMLNALHVMLSSLMSPEYSSDYEKIDVYVKVFLSSAQRASRLVTGNDQWWTKKGNFVSLLNLSRQIKLFGPIRWYYEGVSERHIQLVKPYLVTNLRKTISYFLSKLTLIHSMKCIGWIKHQLKLNDDDDASQRTYKGYYRYHSLEDLYGQFHVGAPISAVRMKNTALNIVFAVYGTPQEMHLAPIRFESAEVVSISQSIPWSNCEILPIGQHIMSSRDAIDSKIEAFCALVPQKIEGTDFQHKFACVFSDWDIIGKNGDKGRSLLSWHVFNTSEYGGN